MKSSVNVLDKYFKLIFGSTYQNNIVKATKFKIMERAAITIFSNHRVAILEAP